MWRSGDEVEVEPEFDPEPRVVADPIARAAYDCLPDGRKREHVRAIERAKKPETRTRRIEKALATLRDSAAGRRGGPSENASFEVEVGRVLNADDAAGCVLWLVRRSSLT